MGNDAGLINLAEQSVTHPNFTRNWLGPTFYVWWFCAIWNVQGCKLKCVNNIREWMMSVSSIIAIIAVSCTLLGIMGWINFECDYDIKNEPLQEQEEI